RASLGIMYGSQEALADVESIQDRGDQPATRPPPPWTTNPREVTTSSRSAPRPPAERPVHRPGWVCRRSSTPGAMVAYVCSRRRLAFIRSVLHLSSCHAAGIVRP